MKLFVSTISTDGIYNTKDSTSRCIEYYPVDQ